MRVQARARIVNSDGFGILPVTLEGSVSLSVLKGHLAPPLSVKGVQL